VHLDAGYDYQPCRQVLAERGMVGQIATRGVPAPIQAGRRWVIERTHARANQCGLRAMVTGVLRCGYDPATHGFDGEPAFRLRWQTNATTSALTGCS
jgi:hypothetical protein